MKKKATIILALLVLLSLILTLSPSAEDKFPARQGFINDFAGVIPANIKQEMDLRAKEVLQKTGTSVLVATVPTIGENYLSGYVNDLYRTWGVGKKGENKGVLIFVAVKERKVRIETGYGVEGILPDGKVGEIIRNDIVPHLKKGDYGTGLLNALKSVSLVIAADAKVNLTGVTAPRTAAKPAKSGGLSTTAIVMIVLAVFGIIGIIIWVAIKYGGGSGSSSDSGSSFVSSSPGYSSSSSSSYSSSDSSSSDSGSCSGGDSGGGGSESDY